MNDVGKMAAQQYGGHTAKTPTIPIACRRSTRGDAFLAMKLGRLSAFRCPSATAGQHDNNPNAVIGAWGMNIITPDYHHDSSGWEVYRGMPTSSQRALQARGCIISIYGDV
jgi:hypothetical protein